jgi:hypothetical protein
VTPAASVLSGAVSAVLVGAVSALSTGAASVVLRRGCPGDTARWDRTTHRGDRVTLLEGPSFVAGSVAAAALSGLSSRRRGDGASTAAGAVAVLAAGSLGAWDDLRGDDASKGLRGHLSALRQGRLTTGSVKIIGLAVSGLVSSWLVERGAVRSSAHSGAARAAATVAGGGVVAGTANVVNLFDLRPGRALKVVLATALPLAPGQGGRSAAIASGAALALLPEDLAGRSMLGDTGANGAGALLGTAILERTGLRGRLVALGLLTALTLASEKVSFTRVIESTPVLRELDALGRSTPG